VNVESLVPPASTSTLLGTQNEEKLSAQDTSHK